MGKGNIAIDKSMIKTVVDGKIIIPLPNVLVENRYYPMFSIFSPTQCDICGSKLHINSHHTRFLLSRYGTISLNVTYWLCPTCKKHYHDQVIGVQGSANCSSEYYDTCSLHNSRRIGETYTEGVINVCGRAPCPTSLWLYEQKQAKLSKQELLNQGVSFEKTLYVNGNWIKNGWKKSLKNLLERNSQRKNGKKCDINLFTLLLPKRRSF